MMPPHGFLLLFHFTYKNSYTLNFGGLQGSRSTPRATTTRNINKQQQTKNTPLQWRRKRVKVQTGGSAGEVCEGIMVTKMVLRVVNR
jgi:hypothetical protein